MLPLSPDLSILDSYDDRKYVLDLCYVTLLYKQSGCHRNLPKELHGLWHHQKANQRILLVFSGEKKGNVLSISFNSNSRKKVKTLITKQFESHSGNDNCTSVSFLGGNVTVSSQRMSSSSRSWLPQIDAVN